MIFKEDSSANLKEIGDLLRQTREERGMSVEEVVAASKISKRNIEALESGDQKAMPHPVYVKGFVKTYAELLQLDPEPLQKIVAEALQAEDADDESMDLSQPLAEMNRPASGFSRRWPVILVIGALALAMIMGGLYLLGPSLSNVFNDLFSASPAPDSPVTEVAAPEKPAPKETLSSQTAYPAAANATAHVSEDSATAPGPRTTGTETTAAEAAAGETTGADAASTQSGSASAAADADSAEPPVAGAAGQTEQDAKPQPGRAIPAGPAAPASSAAQDQLTLEQSQSSETQTVIIQAFEACWVETKADNAIVRDFYLRSGEKADLQFKKSLTLRLGNAGGVNLTYNGQPVALQANSGEVKVLQFPLKEQ